jgi:hypothetical protein
MPGTHLAARYKIYINFLYIIFCSNLDPEHLFVQSKIISREYFFSVRYNYYNAVEIKSYNFFARKV